MPDDAIFYSAPPKEWQIDPFGWLVVLMIPATIVVGICVGIHNRTTNVALRGEVCEVWGAGGGFIARPIDAKSLAAFGESRVEAIRNLDLMLQLPEAE